MGSPEIGCIRRYVSRWLSMGNDFYLIYYILESF